MTEETRQDTYCTRATLIQRVKNQDDDMAWEDFVRTYRRYIYAIIRNMNLSEEDAEDLSQKILLNVWKKLPETNVQEIQRFRSWLATATKNTVIDFIRKRHREEQRLKEAQVEIISPDSNHAQLPNLDQIAEREWKRHLTSLAMENISPHFSGHAIEVFRLSLNGMSTRDIATNMNLSENSICPLKARVRERLILEIQRLRDELE